MENNRMLENKETWSCRDFHSMENIVNFAHSLRDENIDMYVACRLLCIAYIYSEFENPTNEEIMIITSSVMEAWYKSDCIRIESLVGYLLDKYVNKEYSLKQIEQLDPYDILDNCAYSEF